MFAAVHILIHYFLWLSILELQIKEPVELFIPKISTPQDDTKQKPTSIAQAVCPAVEVEHFIPLN
jgi:hypothetical protein